MMRLAAVLACSFLAGFTGVGFARLAGVTLDLQEETVLGAVLGLGAAAAAARKLGGSF